MKKLRLILSAALLLMLISPTIGSHIVGLRITYQSAGGGVYFFKLKLYRDCSGITAPTSASICFKSASNCAPTFYSTLALNAATSGNQVPFNSCQGVAPTTCAGGSLFAFEEYNYEGFVTVPPCSDWTVSWDNCCRNAAITNLVDPDMYSAYVETRFDNLNYPTNSSPEFNSVPVNYYCAGIPAMVDYSAYDLDGDSLSYEFTPIYDGSCGTGSVIPFQTPFTASQPLATLTSTIFDPVSGQITFTPSNVQISVIGFKVNEYRNGQLIGSVRRDDEVVVVGGLINPDTIAGRVYFDMNANAVFDGGDFPASGIWLSMGLGNTYATSNGAGKYEFQAANGAYNLSIPSPPVYWNVVPGSIAVPCSGTGVYHANNDFALQSSGSFNDLVVSLDAVTPPVPGNNMMLSVNYENAGTNPVPNASIQVLLDPGLQFVSANPAPNTIAGNLLTWNYANIAVFQNGTINIVALTDSTLLIGDSLFCTATINPVASDFTPANNVTSLGLEVLSSFDPNSKSVSPTGDLDLAFITSQQWITYTIHFQNLGNFPAQIVRITDGLDFDFDYGSLEVLSSSFPCSMSFTAPNQLGFEFFGINLPAASVNEPMSHGFVKFRIKPKATLMPGTLITNSAQIKFDFNAPIFTNLVLNKVVTTTGVEENGFSDNPVSLYPNPATDAFTVEAIALQPEYAQLTISNILGEKVYNVRLALSSGTNTFSIPVYTLPSGIYFVELKQTSATSVAKLMKQ